MSLIAQLAKKTAMAILSRQNGRGVTDLETPTSDQVFANIMEFVKAHDYNPRVIKATIRILAQRRQTELLASVIRNGDHHVPYYGDMLFGCNMSWYKSMETMKQPQRILNLARDIVLPWPRTALGYQTLNYIGKEVGRPWLENPGNHQVMYFLPLEIGFVCTGNHSIASGIVHQEGTLRAYEVFDLSDFYAEVRKEGSYYIVGGKKHEIIDFDMAAIFELGRLLVEQERKNGQE